MELVHPTSIERLAQTGSCHLSRQTKANPSCRRTGPTRWRSSATPCCLTAKGFYWKEVPTPEGQRANQFESKVKRAAEQIGPGFEAEPYNSGSKRNSNFFVYSVIKGAGGIPSSAIGTGGVFG